MESVGFLPNFYEFSVLQHTHSPETITESQLAAGSWLAFDKVLQTSVSGFSGSSRVAAEPSGAEMVFKSHSGMLKDRLLAVYSCQVVQK